jgi:hypothetical protein
MAYKGPYLGVRMVDGSTHNLPGRMGDVSPLLEAEGPLVRTEDVYGNDLLINTHTSSTRRSTRPTSSVARRSLQQAFRC